MTEPLQRIRVVSRAEIVLLKIHLRSLAKKTVLCAAGLLVVLLAVGMLNLAGYMFLAERLEPPVAALLLAAFNAVIAVGLFLTAKGTRPGPEAAMAEEVRDLAVAELQTDADAVRANFNEMKADVQRIRSGISGIFGGGGSLRGLMHIGPLLDVVTSSLKRAKGK
jgi:hypothetical protein